MKQDCIFPLTALRSASQRSIGKGWQWIVYNYILSERQDFGSEQVAPHEETENPI